MSLELYQEELAIAKTAALAAGAAIQSLGVTGVANKADGSPVTAADMAANQAIVDIISQRFPEDGLLSEESDDGALRLARERVWIIDPLDGTRDFVQQTGQFAVHVALAVGGIATVGVVLEPTVQRLSWAVRGQGAFMSNAGLPALPLHVSGFTYGPSLRVGTSRFALGEALRVYLQSEPPLQAIAMGASTKVMALARGELEACVWLSGVEKEWDTCAPEVIVTEAGGRMTDSAGRPFFYNKRDVVHHHGIIASNGRCHDELVARARPHLP